MKNFTKSFIYNYMKKFISKILQKISLSVLKDNTHSTHRVQSYVLMIPILLMVITFLAIEIYQFIFCIHTGLTYAISSEIIITFGMLLTHHITVLFQKDINNKNSDLVDNVKIKDEANKK